MTYGPPSNSIFSPFRKSEVVYIPGRLPSDPWWRALGEERDPLPPGGGDLRRVLEPDAPQPRQVYPGLHRDDHPLLEEVPGSAGEGRSLVDVQPYPVPGRMNKILQISG